MTYLAVLTSVSPAKVDRIRSFGGRPADLHIEASRVEEFPHDLTAIDIQPLGAVLAEAIDIGQPLRNEGWHPLRAPVVVDPETVMARAMKLEAAFLEAGPQLGGMIAEMLGEGIDKVRALYAHASSRGEAVVSFLSAPDDVEKADRALVPDVHVR